MIEQIKALIAEMEAEAAKHPKVLQAMQFLQGAVIELEQHHAEHPPAPAAVKPGKAQRGLTIGTAVDHS